MGRKLDVTIPQTLLVGSIKQPMNQQFRHIGGQVYTYCFHISVLILFWNTFFFVITIVLKKNQRVWTNAHVKMRVYMQI